MVCAVMEQVFEVLIGQGSVKFKNMVWVWLIIIEDELIYVNICFVFDIVNDVYFDIYSGFEIDQLIVYS